MYAAAFGVGAQEPAQLWQRPWGERNRFCHQAPQAAHLVCPSGLLERRRALGCSREWEREVREAWLRMVWRRRGDGGALAFAGGLGQVFDGGLEDGKVAEEGGGGGVGSGVLESGGLGQEGLKPAGVEALGIEAAAEGVGVACLGAAATGGICFVVGTNKGQIVHGAENLNSPWRVAASQLPGTGDGPSRGFLVAGIWATWLQLRFWLSGLSRETWHPRTLRGLFSGEDQRASGRSYSYAALCSDIAILASRCYSRMADSSALDC